MPIKISRSGNYISGGAPEILERMKLLSQKGGNLESSRATNSNASEESARQVMGASEFSSRNLVNEMSPTSRFKD